MRPDPEERALRRARWAITAQIAVVVSMLVAVAGGDRVRDAAVRAARRGRPHAGQDDRARPGRDPARLRLAVHPGAARARGPVPGRDADRGAGRDGARRPATSTRERRPIGGMTYTIRVENRGGVVSQAFFEERYQIQDRSSLVSGLGGRGGAGAAGGRAVRPGAGLPGDPAPGRRAAAAADVRRGRVPRAARPADPAAHARAAAGPARVRPRRGRPGPAGARARGSSAKSSRTCCCRRRRGDRPEFELVELGVLAEEAVAAEAVRAGEGRVRLAVTRERRPYVVQGVPTALRRVLSALLDNALGHTPPGGSIEVWLGVPDDRHVELRVRDTGARLPAGRRGPDLRAVRPRLRRRRPPLRPRPGPGPRSGDGPRRHDRGRGPPRRRSHVHPAAPPRRPRGASA